jgi:hypothetical protein
MSRIADALARIEFARTYTRGLIDTFDAADWFRTPVEGVTHLGWQVGHLAIAEYFLCLVRFRGVRPEDEALLSRDYIACFDKGSAPVADATKYPSPSDILAGLDRVHAQVLRELPEWPDADLDSPILKPHRLCKTKIEVVRWCAAHEMMHGGQIGLLRRLFGHAPIW